jgi:3',5'-cyclic-AMP phosphodiesterase
VVQLGLYPAPQHVIAHISDPHLLAHGRPLYGTLDVEKSLERGLTQLELSGRRPEAIVVTGDLADLGEPDAYVRLRAIVEPAAERMGATMIWVMGNHDERPAFTKHLLDLEPSTESQDRVYDINGLRIIALDSTVPGYHHGELDDAQLDWLAEVLATPAPHGTVLALHHPPVPSLVEVMSILELRNQPRFAEVVRGTDVRVILGGHLHYSTHGMFAGVPVSVAAGTCYSLDVGGPVGSLLGVDGGQAVNLVQFHEDTVTHSVIPIGDPVQVSGVADAQLEQLARMTETERLEAFSNKTSTYNLAEAESSGDAG